MTLIAFTVPGRLSGKGCRFDREGSERTEITIEELGARA